MDAADDRRGIPIEETFSLQTESAEVTRGAPNFTGAGQYIVQDFWSPVASGDFE
jgi:hypothetical protein